jgi:hypothetical protein
MLALLIVLLAGLPYARRRRSPLQLSGALVVQDAPPILDDARGSSADLHFVNVQGISFFRSPHTKNRFGALL